ncbi:MULTISPECIES: hypothetical protein [Streptomyces]|uniref:hypothetical protein n=1 Tax=Streptomyces TaxID=1883 RepID=UPI003417AF9D
MAARIAVNGLGCIGRSAPTEYAFDVAGIVCVTARKTTEAEGANEIFRQKAARGRYQDGLGAVAKFLVPSGIVACPRASAVGFTLTTVADDLPAVTAGYDNERARVQQMVRQAVAIPGEAAAPR